MRSQSARSTADSAMNPSPGLPTLRIARDIDCHAERTSIASAPFTASCSFPSISFAAAASV